MSAPESNKPIFIHGLSESPRSMGSILVGVLAVCVIGAGMYWAYHYYQGVQSDVKVVAEIEDLTRKIRGEEKRIVEALGRGQIVSGMTRQQAVMARGKPWILQRGETLIAELVQIGAVEHWIYSDGGDETFSASFDLNGYVIRSSDKGSRRL